MTYEERCGALRGKLRVYKLRVNWLAEEIRLSGVHCHDTDVSCMLHARKDFPVYRRMLEAGEKILTNYEKAMYRGAP